MILHDPLRQWASFTCVTVLLLVAVPDVPAGDFFTQIPVIEESRTGHSSAPDAHVREPLKVDFDEGPTPQWVWAGGEQREETSWFRARFEGGARLAKFVGTCDNQWDVSINGKTIVKEATLETPIMRRIEGVIREGENEILVRGTNFGGIAGLLVKVFFEMADGTRRYLVTDGRWEFASDPNRNEWRPVQVIPMPEFRPLREHFFHVLNPDLELVPDIPRGVFRVLPGFQVERLYDVPNATQGSWVCLVLDHKGRLLASTQRREGLYRIEPSPIGSEEPTRVEKLDVAVGGTQGMVAAFGSLYVLATDPPESALFRLRDTTGDDQYDEIVKLRFINGAGEHGPHALRLSPDGKWIYMIAGNFTKLPEINSSRVPLNWKEDQLLPYHPDPFGFGKDVLAPGGFVCRFNEDATHWELISIGHRNPYDMDFSPDGELFTFDADMEDDMGTAWYRPTRVCHVVSGSDFGWRNGSGKWPPYYADTLPPVVEIGPGSPVGVTFGTGARFPEAYQRALYVLDWSFGTIHAVHLECDGASFAGAAEEFLSRSPLPLTDAVVGHDGALYFTTGGRGLPSALFRVTWPGDDSIAPVAPEVTVKIRENYRNIRYSLSHFHKPLDEKKASSGIETMLALMKNDDRFLRYAARIALEHQDIEKWREPALAVTVGSQRVIALVVALARQGGPSLRGKLLAKLRNVEFDTLSEQLKLELLRAYAVVCIRMGRPDPAECQTIIDHIDFHYPARTDALNRELSRLLVYLEAPTVIERTLGLMDASAGKPSREITELLARNPDRGGKIARMIASGQEPQNTHYARILSNVRYGWTLNQRKEYFEWIRGALARRGGRSYEGYIENIRKRALENASEAERTALAATSSPPVRREADLPRPHGPGREWSLDEIVKRTASGLKGRNFDKGKRAYDAGQCVLCHRFDGDGGGTGPDLTDLGGRFSLRDIAEAIVAPSKAIPDRYQASVVVTTAGDALTGRVIGETDDHVSLLTDPVDLTQRAKIKKADILQRSLSPTSLMPEGLLNTLNEDEVLDLIAYLISRGNSGDPVFAD